jgi:hypothetical protein|tara:strand:+ start:257 stop:430 length:174 start_codon:yes stop_codon:yes gene_type:complete
MHFGYRLCEKVTGAVKMIKYAYPDGSHCYSALHPDQSGPYTFEIKGFEILEAGVFYD